MKLSNKYIAFAGVALLMASCDLDKFPEGDYISEEQKEDIINGRPNLITAEVNAMDRHNKYFGKLAVGSVGLQYILDKHKKGKRDRVSYTKVELPHHNSAKGDHIPHEQEYNTRHGVSAIADEVCREIRR